MGWPWKSIKPIIQGLVIGMRKMKEEMVSKLPPPDFLQEDINSAVPWSTVPPDFGCNAPWRYFPKMKMR
jgi:hypothetical protein